MKKYFLFNAIFLFFCVNVFPQATSQVNQTIVENKNSESFQSFTFDGAWCWFSDPRAVYFEGKHKRTYSGWVNSYGDVVVAYYDHVSKVTETIVLEDNFETDDHNNPSLLFSPEGKLMVFFTKHASPNPILLFKMKNAEDISSWDKKEFYLNDKEKYSGLDDSYTYVNPVMLSGENNRIYIFWRGTDFKPCFSYSDDMGDSWSKGRIFILPERIYEMRRPYLKVSSNNSDKIFFAFTDGHPRKENENSIYFMYLKQGKFFNIQNKPIGKLGAKPISPSQASLVYDATKTKIKSWIWDIATDENDKPVIAFTKFPDDNNHIYCYSKWDGHNWKQSEIVNSGAWFPETKIGEKEREPNYSGGISIDHENTNIVYVSVKRDSSFEIEKWEINNGEWKNTPVTNSSSKDNVRPFAIRNAREGNSLQILWMQNSKYVHYTDYLSSIKLHLKSPVNEKVFDVNNIKNMMKQAADWQLSNPYNGASRLDWHWGAFYVGLEALYEVSKENQYLNEMKNLGQKFNWKLMDEIYHADRLTIADVFAWNYQKEANEEYIDKAKWAMDIHLARNAKPDVSYDNNNYRFEWWTWCDALFMAPPSFARMFKATKDISYLDYADKFWWITSDYLYSPEDSLFFRDDRFFEKKSKNGNKIFWGRGNGWVVAGLARMLNIIPIDYPSRSKYENQYREMAYKLLSLQRDHGLWTASLYDPEELPMGESSASAFYTYALAWGVNNGLLKKEKFVEPIKKAWSALCKNVNENGRLGYVQQVAGDPYPFFEDQWHVYATGAFLLCGKEMIELAETNLD